jgi:hypothetical protein
LEKERTPIKHFRETHTSAKAFRGHILSSLLFNRRDENLQKAAQEYGDVNAKYFSEGRAEVESRTNREIQRRVDASKDPYHLLWVDASDRFDLRAGRIPYEVPSSLCVFAHQKLKCGPPPDDYPCNRQLDPDKCADVFHLLTAVSVAVPPCALPGNCR